MNIPAAPVSNGTLNSSGALSQATANTNTNTGNINDAKQRRREKRAAKSDSNAGPTTTTTTTQTLAPSRRKRSQLEEENAASRRGGGTGSVLWTILVIGLVFCLVDVLYIMGFVDRQQVSVVPESSSGSGTPVVNVQQLPRVTRQVDTDNSARPPRVGEAAPRHDHPFPPLGHKFQKGTPVPRTKDLGQVRDKIESEGAPHADNGNGLGNDQPVPVDPDELIAKERILELIRQAGVKIDLTRDADIIRELPTWKDVTDLYGPKPVIHGLDQCEIFQTQSDRAEHFVSTAGAFNSGTNLMAELLIANCHMQDRMTKYGAKNRGVRWQVPWGKHTPPGNEEFRQAHKTLHDAGVDANNILPAVTIRDPLFWLGSMCKHHYTAKWQQGDHCPDFSPTNDLQTSIKYFDFSKQHDSILHHWNDYYNEYLNVDFPRLLVRYEDLLFHPQELTKSVCECAGGSMRRDGSFVYIVDSAKRGVGAHGSARTGYVDAMIKYGSEEKRYAKYVAKLDLEYIRDHVDANLMTLLGYPAADPEKLPAPSPDA